MPQTFPRVQRSDMFADLTPVIRVLHLGHLVALTSAEGVVVYSTAEGDRLMGSYSGTRGQNLSNFLQLTDIMELISFLSHARKGADRGICTIKTRSGMNLVVDADLRLQSIWDVASDAINDSNSSMLRKTSNQDNMECDGDMSFSDAFEQAAVEDVVKWSSGSSARSSVPHYGPARA